MRRLLRLTALSAGLVLALLHGEASAASFRSVLVRPAADVSLPFRCDWGYDWDERCYRDDSEQLSIGGDSDKVWRAALRFELGALPPDATVVGGELRLYFEGACVAPGGGSRPCGARAFALDAHPITSADWFHEREVDFDPWLARAELAAWPDPGWLVWDVSDVVSAWAVGDLANDGLLVKLSDADEDLLSGGPKLASSSYPISELRPQLEVTYLEPEPD
jgi:hypothetical protein